MAENTGLLGFLQSPEGQGLLSAAFGGMAGARRGTPWNNAGRAGLSGIAGYGGALDRQTQQAQLAKQNEVRDLQVEQMRRQAGLQQRNDAWRQQLPSLTTPQLTGTTEQERILAEQNGAFGEDGARSLAQIGNLPGMNYGVDKGKLNEHLMSPDSPFADEILKRQLFPTAADYKVVGNSLVKIDPTKGTAAPVFSEAKPEDKEPDAVRQYRFAQGQGYKGDFTSWLLAKQKAGATNVNVSTEKSLLGKVAGEVGQQIGDSRVAAQGAVKTIDTVNRLRDALDSGKVMAGPGASFMQFGAQVGNVLGVGGKDNTERLTNTRQAIQSLAQLELGAAAQMKGQGQITEAERSILKRAESGDFDKMTVPELRLLADTMDRLARKRIEMHNSQIDPLTQNPEAKALAPYLRVTPPGAYQSRTSIMRQPQQPAAPGGIQFLGFENN